jgi:DNA polymerase-3 subunit delta'
LVVHHGADATGHERAMTDATASPAPAPWLAPALQSLLNQRGHAWLLSGPSGLGQYTLAMELARAWLCLQASDHGACGQCTSCRSIDLRTHPDLCLLMPETQMLEKGWPLHEKALKEIEDKSRKPSREIRVDAARDMVAFTQTTRSGGRHKVVLIYPAERMNHITANTILKTLEEPPGDTRFLLVSEAAHLLLPTLRSRCQTHSLAWPDAAPALQWLTSQGVAPADAKVLLDAAGGRPEDAWAMAQSGLKASTWLGLPQAMARGDSQALQAWAPAQVVAVLQKICHDCQMLAVGAAPRFFPAQALPVGAPLAALTQWSKDLLTSARSAEHPFNAGLMLEALVSQARGALHAKHGRH